MTLPGIYHERNDSMPRTSNSASAGSGVRPSGARSSLRPAVSEGFSRPRSGRFETIGVNESCLTRCKL